ncbi:MAG: prepilin-type N-terminal cleavage/methylation domain-containing protein [Proteobacteria bacterium]|nr:prepilin-type N-terminal cleavage/methylation domain-containing protein [Pseudomonadota bacterium]
MSTRVEQAGFSLVEVLVALAIGALVTTMTLGTLTEGLARTRNGEKVLAAKQLAQSRLQEWYVTHDPRGEQGVAGDYRWRIEARPYLLNPADQTLSIGQQLSEITVTVEWQDDQAIRTLTLRTFRAELPQ